MQLYTSTGTGIYTVCEYVVLSLDKASHFAPCLRGHSHIWLNHDGDTPQLTETEVAEDVDQDVHLALGFKEHPQPQHCQSTVQTEVCLSSR